MKVRVDLPFSLQCVTKDALLKERISLFFLAHPHFSVSFTPEPPLSRTVDLGVIPAQYCAGLDLPVPVIAYGASSEFQLACLDGCADFLREPWTPEELFWRACRLLRNQRLSFSWGVVSIFPSRAVSSTGEAMLTYQEYRLLSLLARFRGEAVSREALMTALGTESSPESRSLDMHISSLRKKLSALSPSPPGESSIKSVRDYGYLIP